MTTPDSKLMQDVRGKIVEYQLDLPDLPEGEVRMPPDISEVEGAELGRLLGRFAALIAYGRVKAAEASVDKAGRKARYDLAKAKEYLILRQNERMTEREREYTLELNNEVGRAKRDYVQAEQVYELTEAVLSGYVQCYSALSRELSRRGISAERGYA